MIHFSRILHRANAFSHADNFDTGTICLDMSSGCTIIMENHADELTVAHFICSNNLNRQSRCEFTNKLL